MTTVATVVGYACLICYGIVCCLFVSSCWADHRRSRLRALWLASEHDAALQEDAMREIREREIRFLHALAMREAVIEVCDMGVFVGWPDEVAVAWFVSSSPIFVRPPVRP